MLNFKKSILFLHSTSIFEVLFLSVSIAFWDMISFTTGRTQYIKLNSRKTQFSKKNVVLSSSCITLFTYFVQISCLSCLNLSLIFPNSYWNLVFNRNYYMYSFCLSFFCFFKSSWYEAILLFLLLFLHLLDRFMNKRNSQKTKAIVPL